MPMLTPKIILEAMQERAPRLHRELQAAGTLEAFVQERIDLANESMDLACSEILNQMPKAIMNGDALERVALDNERKEAARREAIEQAIEFPSEDQDPTTGSPPTI